MVRYAQTEPQGLGGVEGCEVLGTGMEAWDRTGVGVDVCVWGKALGTVRRGRKGRGTELQRWDVPKTLEYAGERDEYDGEDSCHDTAGGR